MAMPIKLDSYQDDPGEPGGLKLTRSDLKLIDLALRRHWSIPEEVFERLAPQVAQIFENPEEHTRNRLGAAKILLNIASDNRDAVKVLLSAAGYGDKTEVNVNQVVGVESPDQRMTASEIAEVYRELRAIDEQNGADAVSDVPSAQADD